MSLPPAKLEGFNKDNKTSQSIFWGLGGDGTIGCNKAAIKSCIDEAHIYAQGYFAYSADKSNSLTRSYLRMSPEPIRAHYTISEADFVGCTLPSYVNQYPMVDNLKEGGVSSLTSQEMILKVLISIFQQNSRESLFKSMLSYM